jgi:hypothetical protein
MPASISGTNSAFHADDRRGKIPCRLRGPAFNRADDLPLTALPAAALMSLQPLSFQALMWEWQRRDPTYRAFAAQAPAPHASTIGAVTCLHITASKEATQWGCLFAEHADMPVTMARLFWTAERDPFVLSVSARRVPAGTENSLDIAHLSERVVLLCDDSGREQLLVGSAATSLRLDIGDGTLRDGPVALTYHVPGFGAAAPQLQTIALLHQLQRYLCLPPFSSITAQIWRREVSRLVAFDALARGASHREIGALIFGQSALDDGWDSQSDRVRSLVKRLVRDARRLAGGDYRNMLLQRNI